MLKIFSPADGTLVTEVASHSPKDVQTAYETARRAQPRWAATPLAERVAMIKRFRERLVQDKERLAKILTSEMGKPIAQARNEVGGVLGRIDFFIENTERALEQEVVFKDPSQKLEERISHDPLGVVANISAWNYPYFVGTNAFIPALLTGNTVLYKPSEFATLSGLEMTKALHEAGVPKDVFLPLIGGGEVGAAILEQQLDGIFFTGSYATGQKIADTVGRRMVRMQLELGGKDPIYVCSDVASGEIKSIAAGIADGAFYNTGQSCCSVERIYVHASVFENFVEEFVREVKSYVLGDPTSDKTYIGPLTRHQQLSFLEAQVDDAVKKGAKLLAGGKAVARAGNFFEPTVLTNVDSKMRVMREESFGPIIGIQRVATDEEALQLMNDSDYGLTAGVYTPDRARALKLMGELSAGSVYWNCCDRVSPRLPWTGRRHSGVGSTLSIYGIRAFTQLKAWHLKG